MLRLSFCIFLFLGLGQLVGKLECDEILVVPNNHIVWEENTLSKPFMILSEIVKGRGTTVRLSNLSEFIDPKTFQLNLSNVKKIIFCNTPRWIYNWQGIISNIPKEKLMLIMYDSPLALPDMYTSTTKALFGSILTMSDSLVDNKESFKFYYPSITRMSKNHPPFSERKLLTQISNDRTSYHVNGLYSARKEVVEFFEKKTEDVFEFYGSGWGKKFRNYRGSCSNKQKMLKNYRFCFAYENMSNIDGYVTDKIFKCFYAGTVPIYLGASNVSKFIPKNCYIARQDFFSLDELYTHVRNMEEEEYNRYLNNIRQFLKSSKARRFSFSSFAKVLHKVIYKTSYEV